MPFRADDLRRLGEQARIMKKADGYSLVTRTIIAVIVSVLGLVYLVMTRQ